MNRPIQGETLPLVMLMGILTQNGATFLKMAG